MSCAFLVHKVGAYLCQNVLAQLSATVSERATSLHPKKFSSSKRILVWAIAFFDFESLKAERDTAAKPSVKQP